MNKLLFTGKLVFLRDLAFDRGIIKIKYKLNNRENIIEVIIDEYNIEIEDVVNKVVKSLSDDIAKNVLTEVFTEFHGNMEFREFLNKRAYR